MRYREYFGRELRRASVGGLLLSENSYTPETRLPKHQHANAYFMLVVQGGLIERSGSAEFECGSSTLLFHREGATHANHFGSEPARCFGIEFDAAWLNKLEWSANHTAPAAWLISSPDAVALMYKLRNELRQTDAVSEVMIEGLALTLLAETARSGHSTARADRARPEWLNAAHEMIHEESEQHLTTTEIARRVGVHPVTLARSYRASFGKTVGEAVRDRRLQHATRLLAATELPITVIALSTGFADHSHFARAFRHRFGMTPLQFRGMS